VNISFCDPSYPQPELLYSLHKKKRQTSLIRLSDWEVYSKLENECRAPGREELPGRAVVFGFGPQAE
jgi:hypothetical protein